MLKSTKGDYEVKPVKVYAGYNVNKDTRLSSSSGAVFSLLAESILSKKGIVYGVKMADDCYSAEFIRVTDLAGLVWLRGSKYLQAKVGDTYKKIKDDLVSGKSVLFSGTGCQVNGLKSFLGKDYDNLLCVDVICHGTPSPALWRKYAEYQETKNDGKLKNINFRCKDDSWIDEGTKNVLADIPRERLKKIYISKDKDPYMQMFLRDYCLRPSCYECVAKNVKMADLTIADFWGIDNVAPEMNDGNGTSLVLIRTGKGKLAFKAIRSELKLREVSYEDGVRNNPAEYMSCVKPAERDDFFKDMAEMDFEKLEKKYVPPIQITFRSKVKRKIKTTIKSMLRVIRGEKVSIMKSMDYALRFIFDCQEKRQ